MRKKINIAIDGHSSCGKGTLAKYLAKALGYVFIDSGAMYRAVTLYLLRNKIDLDEVKKDPEILKSIKIEFRFNPEKDYFEIFMNNVLIEQEIREMEVANWVSEVSAVKEVRDFLVQQQKAFAINKGVVMDGRDIGTKVIPDAELKIFMTADPGIRARRRFDELVRKKKMVDYDEVLENIRKRDDLDSSRVESPLVKADDAIILDNTNMSIQEQGQVALAWAKGVIAIL
ncbi:MAG: (d)CMP kinase [Flavobacteriales bacterium]|nr:(d)CMP kinase [Flavobacteriales bacterium]